MFLYVDRRCLDWRECVSNCVRNILNPVRLSIKEDMMIFDAFSPRVRSALNYAPVKLSATPRVLLLDDDDVIAMISKASAELVGANPHIEPRQLHTSISGPLIPA